MKARKPNTDQDAEVSVCANGKVLTEYELPASRGAEPRQDLVECFVPVNEGDRITVKGRFSGSYLSGSFDLVVDGSFLADSRMEGREVKYAQNRKIEFKKAVSCPIPEWWTSIESPKDMVEGTLQAKVLDQAGLAELNRLELASREGAKPCLGSLQVVISVCTQSGEAHRYSEKYEDITNGKWRKRESKLVRKSGIPPDSELELNVEDDAVSLKRSAKHRRHWDEKRMGHKPWAKFVFYYRSSDAIKGAGCVQRLDECQDLEPAGEGEFVQALVKTNKKQQSEGDEEDDFSAVSASDAINMDRTFVPEKQPKRTTEQQPTPRKQPTKRLGGFLKVPTSATSSSICADSKANKPDSDNSLMDVMTEANNLYESDEDVPLMHSKGRDASNDMGREASKQDIDDFANSVEFDSRMPDFEDILNAGPTDEGFTFSDGAGLSYASPDARDGFASLQSALGPQYGLTHDDFSVENTILHDDSTQPDPNSTLADTMAQVKGLTAKDKRSVPSADAIRQAIPDCGIDGFALGLLYLQAGGYDDDAKSNAEFERRRGQVAILDPSDDLWYTKEVYAAKHAENSRRDSALQKAVAPAPTPAAEENENLFGGGSDWSFPPGPDAVTSPQPAQAEPEVTDPLQAVPSPQPEPDTASSLHVTGSPRPDPDTIMIKQEEMEVDAPPQQTPTPARVLPGTPQPQPKPAGSAKRPSSSRPASSTPGTSSPATKRAKAQNSERKANLQQQLAAKEARKAEMKKMLKEKNEAKAVKRKEAAERRKREEEEIAELERLNAEGDAELEAMERQLMEEDDDDEEFEEDE